MHIIIENLLGVRRAEIDLDGIVEVVGPNASGKTSVALCALALLSHDANPLGVPAPQVKNVYPHDGNAEGYAHIEGVDWRPGKGGLTVDTGVQPYASPSAVGLIDFTARLGDKERLGAIQAAILPDVADVVDALRTHLLKQLPPQDVDGVLEVISKRGFESAAGIYEERGREAKRQWAEITGRTYGIRVAADWRPEGWLADMDAMTPVQAEEAVTASREALASLHQVQAVSAAEAAQAEEAQAALPGLKDALDAAIKRRDDIRAELGALPVVAAKKKIEDAEAELAKLDAAARTIPDTLQCPCCQAHLVLVNDTLEEWDEAAARQRRDAASGRAEHLREQLAVLREDEIQLNEKAGAMRTELDQAFFECREAENAVAVAEAAAAKAGLAVGDTDNAALAEAEQAVDDAKRVAGMVDAEAKASALAQTIARYAEVVRALGPQGVRAKMQAAGLVKLNKGLAVLADVADWPIVQVSERGAVSWGDRPVAMCSESERWRAQACIQLTLAAMTGSLAIVLDRADLLDPVNRGGLVRAVGRVAGKTGLSVLLCSTGEPGVNPPWTQIAIDEGRTA